MVRVIQIMIKVSIIIPVYNAKKYLANTLDSVIKQTYKNLEIILVNDGSTDNSKDICESYAKIDKRIKVINKENGGVSSARNYGLALAKGEYISFVDSDDFLFENMIETLVNDIQNTNAEIAVCGYWHVTEEEYRKIRKTATNEKFVNVEVLVNPIKYYYSKKYMPSYAVVIKIEPYGDCLLCDEGFIKRYIIEYIIGGEECLEENKQ